MAFLSDMIRSVFQDSCSAPKIENMTPVVTPEYDSCCACVMVTTHGQVTPPSGLDCCSGLLVGPLHSFLLTYCYC